MTPILCAYLLGLLFFTFRKSHVAHFASLQMAWYLFAVIPFVHVLFTLIHAAAFTSRQSDLPKNLALVEIWKEGFVWLLFGISLLCFISSLFSQPRAAAAIHPSCPQEGD